MSVDFTGAVVNCVFDPESLRHCVSMTVVHGRWKLRARASVGESTAELYRRNPRIQKFILDELRGSIRASAESLARPRSPYDLDTDYDAPEWHDDDVWQHPHVPHFDDTSSHSEEATVSADWRAEGF